MARTSIPVQQLAAFGEGDENVTFTSADAANDHSFVLRGDELLIVKNDDAAGKDITFVAPSDSYSRSRGAGDNDKTVPASSIGVFGEFDPSVYRQSDGTMHIDITADTSLSFAVVRRTRN
jgi:hypothetical protein